MLGKLAKTAVVLGAVAAIGATAYAQQMPPNGGPVAGARGQFPPGVFGEVSAISGTTLTVTNSRSSSTIYSVNASGATVTKNGVAGSFSSIAVGDMIAVQGTINGTSVTATKITDGFMAGTGRGGPGGMRYGSSTRPFNGSGTPRFASGTFPGGPGGMGFHRYASSTASSSASSTTNTHPGFFGSIMNFFGGMFGHFKF